MVTYSLNNLVDQQSEQPLLSIAVPPSSKPINSQKDKPPLGSIDIISYGLFGLIFLISLLLEISWRLHHRKPKIILSRPFPQIPCYHCRYFQENPYLKCAVNPSKVLTLEAMDCLDFKDFI